MVNSNKWVQHISGQGEKWEVIEESEWEFEVRSTKPRVSVGAHYLPKSEYRLCPAPEVWGDVTQDCRVCSYENSVGEFWSILHDPEGANVMSKSNTGYRLRKVFHDGRGWAFVVEKKVSG